MRLISPQSHSDKSLMADDHSKTNKHILDIDEESIMEDYASFESAQKATESHIAEMEVQETPTIPDFPAPNFEEEQEVTEDVTQITDEPPIQATPQTPSEETTTTSESFEAVEIDFNIESKVETGNIEIHEEETVTNVEFNEPIEEEATLEAHEATEDITTDIEVNETAEENTSNIEIHEEETVTNVEFSEPIEEETTLEAQEVTEDITTDVEIDEPADENTGDIEIHEEETATNVEFSEPIEEETTLEAQEVTEDITTDVEIDEPADEETVLEANASDETEEEPILEVQEEKNEGENKKESPPPPPPSAKKKDFNIPIVFKQVAVTVVLILLTVMPITHESVSRFSNNSISRARDANRDQANTRAIAVENQIGNTLSNVRLLGALLVRDQSSNKKQEQLQNLVFTKDGAVVSFEIFKKTGQQFRSLTQLTNKDFLEDSMLSPEYIELVKTEIKFPVNAIFSSTQEKPVLEVRNASVENGIPLLAIGMPLIITDENITTHTVVSYLRLDTLQKLITTDERMIFAVDASGTVIAHPDDKLTLGRKKLADSEIVKAALTSSRRVGGKRFLSDEEPFIGAFGKTKYGITVISQVSEKILLEDAKIIRHEAFGIAAMVISLALFVIYLFAMTLTAPIEALEAFARRISVGDFENRPTITSRDEVGRLSREMNSMVDGLIERDKAKNLISKFHGTVGEELMKGNIERKGSRKEVTVFFSDIRGFTSFSESHTAEEVVEMLNDYFAVMVEIINRNNGIIDKFIGDAIMAIWGAFSDDPDEARREAVKACLEMREALVDYNKRREEAGKQIIKIGIGLHSGDAIAGTIGSDERMEYTVIGDTVNLAARIEASTKAFGTDLLISDALSKQVEDEFWLIEAGKAEVKGKAEPITMYKVRGRIKDGEQIEVRTPYSDYEAEGADKVKLVS